LKNNNFSDNAIRILRQRYLKKEDDQVIETLEGMFSRVANNIAQAETQYGEDSSEWSEKFNKVMTEKLFMPNSPALMNAGRPLQMLSACFVYPVLDSIEGIFDAIKYSAMTFKAGGGVGYNFGNLRHEGAKISTTNGTSTGPLSFMKVFNAASEAVKQGGVRRGASMGILPISHPDIIEFINCKEEKDQFNNFNLSVGITNDFMNCVIDDKEFDLIDPHTNKVTKTVNAREIMQLIASKAWLNGEPGVIFLDTLDSDNPTPHLGKIESTNPCFTGDMRLMTVTGYKTFAELAKRPNGLINIINKNNKISQGRVWSNGKKEIIKLTLKYPDDKIKHITCTPNHIFMTADGKECEAKDLLDVALQAQKYYWHKENNPVVIEIEKIKKKEMVYDFSEPITNWGIVEDVIVHNCGESGLLPYEACVLGSINLGLMFKNDEIDWEKLAETVQIAVRFLDDTIDVSNFPIPAVSEAVKLTRKIGIGVMGFADALVKLGIKYDSEEAVNFAHEIFGFVNDQADLASQELAKVKGVYPAWKGSIHSQIGIPRRNAVVTVVAPTGTISIIAGASSGIEPFFALAMERNQADQHMFEVNPLLEEILTKKGLWSEELLSKISKKGSVQGLLEDEQLESLFKISQEIDYKWHIRIQAAIQANCENAVSKTVIMSKDSTVEDVFNAYIMAWQLGCKGTTVYRDGSREDQPLNAGIKEKDASIKEDDNLYTCQGCNSKFEAPPGTCTFCPSCGTKSCSS